MFCDSNRKFLDAHRLWRGIKILPCGSLIELSPLIHSNRDIKSAGMVIIHVGVDDTDKKNGQVFSNLQHVIKVEEVAPNAKIIRCEITPRKDGRDSEVRICNGLINTVYNNNEHPNLTISYHRNLRNKEWSFHDDTKHLSEISIARFAGNLKSAFRRALGINRKIKVSRPNDILSYQKHSRERQPTSESLESFKADLLSKLTSFFK